MTSVRFRRVTVLRHVIRARGTAYRTPSIVASQHDSHVSRHRISIFQVIRRRPITLRVNTLVDELFVIMASRALRVVHVARYVLVVNVRINHGVLNPRVAFLRIVMFNTRFSHLPFIHTMKGQCATLHLSLIHITRHRITPCIRLIFRGKDDGTNHVLRRLIVNVSAILTVSGIASQVDNQRDRTAIKIRSEQNQVAFVKGIAPSKTTFTSISQIVMVRVKGVRVILSLRPIRRLCKAFHARIRRLVVINVVTGRAIMTVRPSKGMMIRFPIIANRQRIVILYRDHFLMRNIVVVLITMVSVFTNDVSHRLIDCTLLLPSFRIFRPTRKRFLHLIGILEINQVIIPYVVNFVRVANVFVSINRRIKGHRQFLRNRVSKVNGKDLILDQLFNNSRCSPRDAAHPVSNDQDNVFRSERTNSVIQIRRQKVAFRAISRSRHTAALPSQDHATSVVAHQANQLTIDRLSIRIKSQALRNLYRVKGKAVIGRFTNRLFSDSNRIRFLLYTVASRSRFIRHLHVFRRNRFRLFLSFRYSFFQSVSSGESNWRDIENCLRQGLPIGVNRHPIDHSFFRCVNSSGKFSMSVRGHAYRVVHTLPNCTCSSTQVNKVSCERSLWYAYSA